MPKHKFIFSCALTVLCLAVNASPAVAGFQWVSPDSGDAQPATVISSAPLTAPTPAPPPLSTGTPEIISPIVITGNNNSNTRMEAPTVSLEPAAPASLAAPAPSIELSSSNLSPSTDHGGNLSNATLSLSASADGLVQGFATQIPLSLALRQILPIGYTFSIDPAVDTETLVSYKGGRGWRETLNDILAQASLSSREQAGTFTINKAGPNAVAAPARAPAASPSLQPAASTPSVTLDAAPAPHPHSLATLSHNNETPLFMGGGSEIWTAQRGDTLHKVLTEWCKRSGIELQWVAEYDYPLEASASFNGDFEDAVRSLLAGFENARPQPVAELHANATAGQKVLVLQARGNSYSN